MIDPHVPPGPTLPERPELVGLLPSVHVTAEIHARSPLGMQTSIGVSFVVGASANVFAPVPRRNATCSARSGTGPKSSERCAQTSFVRPVGAAGWGGGAVVVVVVFDGGGCGAGDVPPHAATMRITKARRMPYRNARAQRALV